MSKRRSTVQQLEASGLLQHNAKHYSNYNRLTGTVIEKDIQLEPPKHYRTETKKAWKAITQNLITIGALSLQDLPSLGTMFDSYDRYICLRDKLGMYDSYLEEDGIDPFLNPEWLKGRSTLHRMMTTELDQFMKAASRFGLTPTERSRLVCQQEEEKEIDPLEAITSSL